MQSIRRSFLIWSGALLLSGCQPSTEITEQKNVPAASTVSAMQTSSSTQTNAAAELPAEIQTFYQELAAKDDTLSAFRFILDHATPEYTQTNVYGQGETAAGMRATAEASPLSDVESQVDVLASQTTADGLEVRTHHAAKGVMAGPGGVVAEFNASISWTTESVDRWVKGEDGQWRLQNSQVLRQTFVTQGQETVEEAQLEPAPEVLSSRKTAIAEILQPLPTLQFAQDLGTPEWLAPYGAAQIVGLGEGSHGTEEIHQLKAQLFKQLATHHGFTVLTFEANPGYVYKINRWLQGEGDEDLDTIFGQSEFNFTVQTTYDLLSWMREQNEAGRQPPFEVWGVDSRRPPFTVRELYKLLPESEAKRNAAVLIQIAPERWNDFTNDAESYPEERQAIKALAGNIAKLPADTPQLFDIQYLAATLQQYDELLDAYTAARDPNDTTAVIRSLSLENEFMARNTQRVTQGEGKKGAIWAHNGHVARSVPTGVSGIGVALADDLGADGYRILCSSLGRGTVNAFDTVRGPRNWTAKELLPPVDYQIDGLAAAALSAEEPAGYLSLDDIRAQPALNDWLSKGMNFSQIGLLYSSGSNTYQQPMNLDSCDGYIFVKESSPSKLVSGA